LNRETISRKRNPGNGDLRNAFENDYQRIILSASFRRLQDKTQVFPLEKNDFIRTRLTHSLEVSTIAKSMGTLVGSQIVERNIDPSF
ncbi:deoxyguanosinetriphosphate triphosphohydrolase, partial [Listeria monocytogenes]|nr:deoxyguanosinetriphosphate triphosphohydrolase [Listeria monocytogenes]